MSIGQQRTSSRGASTVPLNQLLSCELSLERERTNVVREQITQFLLDLKLFQEEPTQSSNRPPSTRPLQLSAVTQAKSPRRRLPIGFCSWFPGF
ncbi:hypothetical protein EG68_02521 [Paragonimus skrjabini miyazakii]|uniref:Uncharacterized protein n=1 Tax=Paragonimus skrjabini miyazakii TaxID=59628 RepID=A0A8S9YXT8_9TREM|nr:hypothetical protein EG68_02521 [Paragonimus skrjabini miyazakii]